MDTKITRDEAGSDARVDFSGYIFISYEEKTAFENELAELIDRYAI